MEESVIRKKPKSRLRKYFRTFILFAIAVIAILIYWNYFNIKSNKKATRRGVAVLLWQLGLIGVRQRFGGADCRFGCRRGLAACPQDLVLVLGAFLPRFEALVVTHGC